MKKIYEEIRKRAREIVSSFPSPDFYKNFSKANVYSEHFFNTDSIISQIQSLVTHQVKNNLGHGLAHATKVSIDAGTLLVVEGEFAGYSGDYMGRRLLLVQCAGLLHDTKRKHKNHAKMGADYAKEVLLNHSNFKIDEVDDISKAIQNHEAFQKTVDMNTPEGLLISDCLYDADKFRWGPDNFTHTIWAMISFADLPLRKFVEFYPKGMEGLSKIRNTFRTETGKKYGPQFIDTGLAIGKELNRVINTEFSEYL